MPAGQGASNTGQDELEAVVRDGAATAQPRGLRLRSTLHDVSVALIVSLGIAICAAAPELIWGGIKIALGHASWADLVSTLLIAGLVAFFVEPILERLRHILEWAKGAPAAEHRPPSALFTALLSMVFALTSVIIHDAMIAFVSQNDLDSTTGGGSPLRAAVALVIEWAIVPFAVALAWQARRSRWLAWPTGILAAFSSLLAGWLFDWSEQTVIATAIPCLAIQYWGYRQMKAARAHHGFVPGAMVVAGTAIVWLVAASLFDASVSALDHRALRLYDLPYLLIDIRFYVGWAIGLALAFSARGEEEPTSL